MKKALEKSGYKLNNKLIWTKPDFNGINYTDGTEIETIIANIVCNSTDRSTMSEEFNKYKYDSWPFNYHFNKTRVNILRPFSKYLKNKDVLEVGAGCGIISRYLGEVGCNVIAVEGSSMRSDITRMRTQDLNNVTVVNDNLIDFKIDKKFDCIVMIGCFEYSGLFVKSNSPYTDVLKHMRSMLKPNGTLIVAIENQLGLKYFAGMLEDHMNIPMFGIENKYAERSVRTFGKKELENIFTQVGFNSLDFLLPFPDYKLPVSIITPEGLKEKDFDAGIFATMSADTYSYQYFNQQLVWETIFKNDLAADLSNSFLIVAHNSPPIEEVFPKSILTIHYSSNRRSEFCKETIFEKNDNGEIIIKYQKTTEEYIYKSELDFLETKTAKYYKGKLLTTELLELAKIDDCPTEKIVLFYKRYLSKVKEIGKSYNLDIDTSSYLTKIPGEFFDCLPHNIIINDNDKPIFFDVEFKYKQDIEIGILIFRSILVCWPLLYNIKFVELSNITKDKFIYYIFKLLNFNITEDDFNRYTEYENNIQIKLSGLNITERYFNFKDTLNKTPTIINNTREVILNNQKDLSTKQESMYLYSLLELEKQKKIIKEIKNSSSWRITKPLRYISDLIKKL